MNKHAIFGTVLMGLVVACSGGGGDIGGGDGDGGGGGSSSSGSSGGTLKEPKVHRPTVAACDGNRAPVSTSDAGTGASGGCQTDAECTQGTNGRCLGGRIGYQCSYDECSTDAQCAAGSVCDCRRSPTDNTACIAATGCKTDADCTGGKTWCSPTLGACGNYSRPASYECHTAADECTDDADCTGASSGATGGSGGYCAFDKTIAHWKCSYSSCAG